MRTIQGLSIMNGYSISDMAKLTINGLDEYALALSKLQKNRKEIERRAIYAGAEIIADEIKKSIRELPIDTKSYGTQENPLHGISRKQKADLIDAMGIAPFMEDETGINVKVGFDGYGSIKTKKYRRGIPNQLLVRSVENGTSFRAKNPFVRTAVNRKRKLAQAKMGEVIDEEIKKEMK